MATRCDVDALADHLEFLPGGVELRRRLGSAAVAAVVPRVSVGSVTTRYAELSSRTDGQGGALRVRAGSEPYETAHVI